MKPFYNVKARKPKNLSLNGTFVTIDVSEFEYLKTVIEKNATEAVMRRMFNKPPRIGAIEVVDDGKLVDCLVFSPIKVNRQFKVDYFHKDSTLADFSFLMTCEKEDICFRDLTPDVPKGSMTHISNFVISVFLYEFIMKLDPKTKHDTIRRGFDPYRGTAI